MVDNSAIKIDNKKYLVVDTIINDNYKFVYLVNEQDEDDFIIRKQIERDEKNYLVPLADVDEFQIGLSLFQEKNKED